MDNIRMIKEVERRLEGRGKQVSVETVALSITTGTLEQVNAHDGYVELLTSSGITKLININAISMVTLLSREEENETEE